jgi:hypothetical protein
MWDRLVAFSAGTPMSAVPLLRSSARLRRPIAVLVVGVLLVLAEILTAQVADCRCARISYRTAPKPPEPRNV